MPTRLEAPNTHREKQMLKVTEPNVRVRQQKRTSEALTRILGTGKCLRDKRNDAKELINMGGMPYDILNNTAKNKGRGRGMTEGAPGGGLTRG